MLLLLVSLLLPAQHTLDAHIFDELLRRIDTNGDGRLTFDELRNHLETEHT